MKKLFALALAAMMVLCIFAGCGANILTINSIVPTNGTAVVTISADTMEINTSIEDMLHMLRTFPGVVKAEVLAG